ncbi:MAG: transposase [Pseudomonadota bacterium]
MTHSSTFVGIDVSKDRLDVVCHPSQDCFHVPNTPDGIATLIARTQNGHSVYGCEASGGLETNVIVALSEAGLACFCLHPSDVRAFARLKGKRAKTDRLDALAIAEVLPVAARHRAPTTRSRMQSNIRQLATVRRQFGAMVAQLKSLKQMMCGGEMDPVLSDVIDDLAARIQALTRSMKAMIEKDRQSALLSKRIMSVPGAGPVLAAELIGAMPEIGTLSSRQVASLAGLAPHPRQSGKSSRPGRCQGGRGTIRRVLYMAALSAIKARKAPFIATYERLRRNRKPFKVAIVAVMRKLIVTINAIVKAQTTWQKNHPNENHATTVA